MTRSRIARLFCLVVLVIVAATACGRGTPATEKPKAPPIDLSPPPKPTVLILGDSVTAGWGLISSQAYPALLQNKLVADGFDVEVENAGVSGDTTAGGLRRMDWVLRANVRVLMVALGANDALRGLTVAETHKNLAGIIEAAQARNISVMLIGMEAPPNLGQDYQTAFHGMYAQLASDYRGVAYVPFLLDGVAGHPELNQADGVHPNEKGSQVIADALYPKLHQIMDAVFTNGGGLIDGDSRIDGGSRIDR